MLKGILLARYQIVSRWGEKDVGLRVLKEGLEEQWTLTPSERLREPSSISP